MKAKWVCVVVWIFLAISLLTPCQSHAGADDLAKQADKIIRNAERKMFSGKNEEASTLLNTAAALIDQGKIEAPGNNKILRVEKKFIRIRKNVDRKLGKITKKQSPSRPTLPPKPKVKAMPTMPSGSAAANRTAGAKKLPGGVTKRLKDIAGLLKKAERYAGQDATKAKSKLTQAERVFAEIEKRYSDKFDPAHPEFAAVQHRYDTLVGKVAEQDIVEAKAKADAVEAKAKADAARAEARAAAAAAEAKTKADAAAAKAAGEKQSAEWTAKFQAYLSYPGIQGHNPDMLVFVPGTSEPEKFAEAQRRYEEFKAFYAAYKKVDFPNGRTWKLEDLADREAPMRLKDFEEGFADRVDSVSGYAEKEIDSAMGYLEKDNGWKSDKTVKPNLVDHRRMTSIRDATQKVISALGNSDPKGKKIQAKFDALVAKDKANRQIRKERTVMIPDRYTGSDIDELKKKAESLVKSNKKEGGKPLRTTIISSNWQEKTVKEWTDTSRSAWRIRTTRSITGQVATKTSDGVRLITVALAKDKQSDGRWGALYGNLHQYSDPMLLSNVNK